MPSREMPHYSMTKTAQLSVARGLADLTAGTKVTVNTVMPGSTQSPGVADLIAGLFPDLDPAAGETQFMKENRSTSLIERLLQPHEIGGLPSPTSRVHWRVRSTGRCCASTAAWCATCSDRKAGVAPSSLIACRHSLRPSPAVSA